jgi:hypothetical protein
VRSVLRPQKRVAAEAAVVVVVVAVVVAAARRPRQQEAVVVADVAVQRRRLADVAVLPQQPENLRQRRLRFLPCRQQRQTVQLRPVGAVDAVARQAARPQVAAVGAVVVERQLLQPARRFN